MKTFSNIKYQIGKDAPELLTALAIVSSLSTVALSIKNTKKAIEKLKDEGLSSGATFLEQFKSCWVCYIPTGLSLVLNIVAVSGSYTLLAKRNAALSGLYLVAVEGLRGFKTEALTLLGEKKYEQLLDGVAQKQLDKVPLLSGMLVVQGTGDVLFFDAYSGRYFQSTIETIRTAVNDFNFELLTEMFKSLNDFYYSIGLDPIDAGELVGWGIENRLEIRFSAQIVNAPDTRWDKQPCIVLSYSLTPYYLE